MIDFLKNVYNKYTSEMMRYKVSVVRAFFRRCFVDQKIIKKQQYKNLVLEKELKKKSRVSVAFFIVSDSEWKYGDLYRLLDQDPRFVPTVVICPLFHKEESYRMYDVMRRTNDTFVKKKYNVLLIYDFDKQEWFDLGKQKFDIIFWGFPYANLTKKEYDISNFSDSLSCYVPYFYGTVKYGWAFDLLFHNLLWLLFCESDFHKIMYSSKSRMEGKNVYVSGYPPFDSLQARESTPFLWKQSDPNLLKLIWAPHHTIFGDDGYSNFLKYSGEMLKIALHYNNKVQFVFRPHPLLKSKLYQIDGWGKDRTNAYFKKWEEMSNTMIWEGEYWDLFKTSDAILHDSGSFMVEYLFTLKPALYFASTNRLKGLNVVGQKAYYCHTLANSVEDIYNFIDSLLEKKDDGLRETRKKFQEKYLLPPNGVDATLNIYNKLKMYVQ